MPDITIKHEIDTDEETFWAKLVFDEAFNKKMYEGGLKFPTWNLLEQKETDTSISRRVQVEPPTGNLPGPVKKVIGDRLAYTEEGTFDKKSKRYSFKVKPSTLAEKTKVNGELWCEKISDKKIRRLCKISVEVKMFAIGGMVEDRILEDLKVSYDKGTAWMNEYIKENGL